MISSRNLLVQFSLLKNTEISLFIKGYVKLVYSIEKKKITLLLAI